jgi:transcriptional regulator with XRE-family HTH domain
MYFQAMKTSEYLREMREAATGTIVESAVAIGVSVGQLWNFEHGKAVPTEKQVKALSDFYLAKLDARANRVRELLGAEI